ncbi:M56 family metallopeptidase [Chloroflexota bacterium]
MLFFESFWGHYLAQAVFYSLITVIVFEGMSIIWQIHESLSQIKFRLLMLLLPMLCPPLYYLLYPPRTAFYFRNQIALFDLNKWLGLPLVGSIAVWHLFLAMLVTTAIVFLIKEVYPMLKYYVGRRHSLPLIEPGQFSELDAALMRLSQDKEITIPVVLLSPEDIPIAYILSRKTLVISVAMLRLLDSDELESVLAHEIAHLSRQVVVINRVLLTLRFLMFYNPIAFLVFRRVINDIEKLCDDIAIRFSAKPLSLTSGLLKILRHATSGSSTDSADRVRNWPRIEVLENVACQNLVRERVEMIIHQDEMRNISYRNFRVAVTGVMLSMLLFFVV